MKCDLNYADSSPSLPDEITRRIAEERLRLVQIAGIADQPIQHFHRPLERPFLAEDSQRVIVLFGGFTWKHERFIEAILRGSGYRCRMLPTPNVASFTFGKEFGNNGQCNPTYFTIGNLIKFLRSLEDQGLTRKQIVENYIFFTAGSCGPCRFGMYESEYRQALLNAGFGGFRIVLFQPDQVLKAASSNPGFKLTLDFNMGAVNMLNLGDVISDMAYRIRPFEVFAGSTDKAVEDAVNQLSNFLETRSRFEILERTPQWISKRLARKKKLALLVNRIGKVYNHLYGRELRRQMHLARERMGQVEVDYTRVKPVVKIVGEFWAQLTEGDGNFNMFAFLEQEGAQVHVDSIGGWISYLLYQYRAHMIAKKGLDAPWPHAQWWQLSKRLTNEWKFRKRWLLLRAIEGFWSHLFARTGRHLGGLTPPLLSQSMLARLAHPFYHSLARGGEGHLEVGKNVYYTTHGLCHMVLALKPFGCMPSSQSDGVQSAVVNRYREMIFLPIETSGEGEINAHSRVQMALGEARIRARAEFDQALASTGKSLKEIKRFAARNKQLRSPFYPIPRRKGTAGVAANFVLHVSDLMDDKATLASLPGES